VWRLRGKKWQPEALGLEPVFAGGKLRFQYVFNEEVNRQLQKQELIELSKARLLLNTFLVSGYRFRFDDGLASFEHRNRTRLNHGSGAQVFKRVKAEAQERFQMAVRRMCRAPLEMNYDFGEGNELLWVYSLSFDWTGLLELSPED